MSAASHGGAIVVVERVAGGHLQDVAARMQEVAVEEAGGELAGRSGGDGGLAAAGNAHNDVNAILIVDRGLAPKHRVTLPSFSLIVTGNMLSVTLSKEV